MRFSTLLASFALLWFAGLAACQSPSDTTSSGTGAERGALGVDARLRELRSRLSACAKAGGLREPTGEQREKLATMFDELQSGPCSGCHDRALARFPMTTGAEAFNQGVAVRHRRTTELVESCFADGTGREKVLADLRSARHASEGDRWRRRGESELHESKRGVPFFTSGSEEDVRGQVFSLAKGAFEEPKDVSDDLLDSIYAWIQAGAALPSDAYVEAIVASLVRVGAVDDVRLVSESPKSAP